MLIVLASKRLGFDSRLAVARLGLATTSRRQKLLSHRSGVQALLAGKEKTHS